MATGPPRIRALRGYKRVLPRLRITFKGTKARRTKRAIFLPDGLPDLMPNDLAWRLAARVFYRLTAAERKGVTLEALAERVKRAHYNRRWRMAHRRETRFYARDYRRRLKESSR